MSRDHEPCAKCGELEREHHHGGACYGKCGAFVPPFVRPVLGVAPLGWVQHGLELDKFKAV